MSTLREACPACGVRDWRHAADHSLPSGDYREWRCRNCGHGTMRLATSMNAETRPLSSGLPTTEEH